MSMFLDREAHAKLLWLARNQELTTHIQKLVNEVDQLGERVEHEYQEKVEAERKSCSRSGRLIPCGLDSNERAINSKPRASGARNKLQKPTSKQPQHILSIEHIIQESGSRNKVFYSRESYLEHMLVLKQEQIDICIRASEARSSHESERPAALTEREPYRPTSEEIAGQFDRGDEGDAEG